MANKNYDENDTNFILPRMEKISSLMPEKIPVEKKTNIEALGFSNQTLVMAALVIFVLVLIYYFWYRKEDMPKPKETVKEAPDKSKEAPDKSKEVHKETPKLDKQNEIEIISVKCVNNILEEPSMEPINTVKKLIEIYK